MKKDTILKTADCEVLHITNYFPHNILPKSCLIFVHGFKGFKDWGFVPYIGEYFAEKGFFVVTFNFSHNGIGENFTEFTELDKFANDTYSRQCNELTEIITAVKSGVFGVKFSFIGLIGHSKGGAVSLLTAYKNKFINAVAVWSSISKLDRYSRKQKVMWRKDGYFSILNSRTGQILKLNVKFLEDIEKNKLTSLNLEKAISMLNKPLLIIHGQQDLTVKISEAKNIFHWSNKKYTQLKIIKSTGHTFNIKHPFEGTNEKFEQVLFLTNKFFKDLENNNRNR